MPGVTRRPAAERCGVSGGAGVGRARRPGLAGSGVGGSRAGCSGARDRRRCLQLGRRRGAGSGAMPAKLGGGAAASEHLATHARLVKSASPDVLNATTVMRAYLCACLPLQSLLLLCGRPASSSSAPHRAR
ncbi:hypothetical protein GUJ93_ZPchr0001g30792 [Zizania palustris]|uniref:Uncharacterized protein n=1 Tax=Zizania palustris TaxID=103762 RepID=A0A8J5R7T1_ZIZPA|nr:hypothetical protein GUJ93_ZPchr0001g30792 [Zizania palustris]